MSTPTGGRYQGRGAGDWRSRWGAPPRPVHDSETRPFFLTSEFLAYLLTIAGLAIAASVTDGMDEQFFWTATTVLTAFYMLSRGVAKSGTRSRAHDPREDIDLGDRD